MTNHLFELAGNRKTETVIPKSKKKWYQGKPVVSAAILIGSSFLERILWEGIFFP